MARFLVQGLIFAQYSAGSSRGASLEHDSIGLPIGALLSIVAFLPQQAQKERSGAGERLAGLPLEGK
jgi:hypothetical protein